MARSKAAQVGAAAAALDAFLHHHRRAPVAGPAAQPEGRHEAAPGSDGSTPVSPGASPQGDHAATRPEVNPAVVGADQPPLRLPHTDWLRHQLVVSGPADVVGAFRDAASGAGVIPWHLDLDLLEEDWFHLLVRPANRVLSPAGARMLARQLRGAVEQRHSLAVSRVGHSQACPLDLHRLVPVPVDVLHLGPDHPDSLLWLWRHWGTTDALRHVALDTGTGKGVPQPRPAAGQDVLRLVFWSADWTPWRAFRRIRTAWPVLRLDVQPDYAAGW